MSKENLYQVMKERFLAAGFTAEETRVHISRFTDRYADMDDAQIEQDLNSHGGAEKVIAHVIRYRNDVLMKDEEYRKFVKSSESPRATEPLPSAPEPVSPDNPDVPESHSSPEESDGWTPGFTRESREAALRRTDEPGRDDSDKAGSSPSGEQNADAISADSEEDGETRLIPTAQTPTAVYQTSEKEIAKAPAKSRQSLADRTYWGEASPEGFRKFWLLFAATLPITILIVAFFTVLCLSVILVLVIGIVALIAALVGVVAAGSAIALIGLIYGVSQLFISLPVGLFETGIGITAVGLTMLTSILIYNLAVRFLPFVLRQFMKFVKFIPRHFRDVFHYLKGECYRQ
ncbi:MAG: hypothetical protein J5938_05645 [Clostridia bacterium]|nr:hypothetical protein [Clostridia bacterium]